MTPLEAVESLILYQPAWMRADEPWFRHWHRVPPNLMEVLKELKSDDLRRLWFDYVKQWLWMPELMQMKQL